MRISIVLFMLVMFVLLAGCGDEGSDENLSSLNSGGGGGGGGLSNGVCLDGTNNGTSYIITVGVSCDGFIDAFADSEFEFTATVTGEYTISLTNTQSDLSWELSVDASFNNFVCDNFFGPGDEICSTDEETGFTLTSGAIYFLLVREWDNVSGSFNLVILPN